MNNPIQPGAPGPKPPPVPTAEWLIEKYRALRDKKKAIEDEHAQQLAPFRAAMAAIEDQLLSGLNDAGANSIQTSHGTAYRTTRTTYGVEDPAVFRAWVEANGKPEFYENRVSKEAVEAYAEQYKQLPPGIKVSSATTVNIRK